MHFLATVAALSAVATTAQAASAIIHNHCSETVYVWAIDTDRNPGAPSVVAPGGTWSEPYYTPKSGGVSVKMARSPSREHITQFEYTVSPGTIWYDGSNIDCSGPTCPFNGKNLLLEAGSSACPQAACHKSDALCTNFYNVWNDDLATKSCGLEYDTTFHLCMPDSQMPGGAPAAATSAAAASPVASVAAVASSAAASPVAEVKAVASSVVAAVASPSTTAPSEVINEAPKPMTTFATSIKVKVSPRAEPAPVQAVKRQERRHIHGHAHAHIVKV